MSEWTNGFIENSVGKESVKHAFEDENLKSGKNGRETSP